MAYLKHDLDMHDDPKLLKLYSFGDEGRIAIDCYWYLAEYVCQNHKPLDTDPDNLDFLRFCHNLMADRDRVISWLDILCKATLCYKDGTCYSSHRADREYEEWEAISESARERGKRGGRGNKKANEKLEESYSFSEESNSFSEKSCRKAKKEEEKKEEEKKEEEKDKGKGLEKPTRHKYGEYSNVLLSDEDLSKLRAEFPSDWQPRIERLSEYMASTGKTYKNHLATIRKWSKVDAANGRASPRTASKLYEPGSNEGGWL